MARPSPPTAQHAIRQGPTVARNVAAELGIGRAEPFSYRNRGAFVNLGRYKAVGQDRAADVLAASPPGGWRAPTT